MPETRTLPRRQRLTRLAAELHCQLRTETATPFGNALSVGLGAFIGCLPIYGFHLAVCLPAARLFRADYLKTYLAANVSNPLLAPFLLYLEFGVGHWLFEQSWPALQRAQLVAEGPLLLGRDVLAGSLVVGLGLGGLLGLLAFQWVRRSAAAPFVTRLRAATARRYVACGISHWEFVRGKLRYDPVYQALLLGMGELPRDGRVLDVGCGRGILLALLATARELGPELPTPPPGWRPPSDRLELVGLELRPRLAAVATTALGDAARILEGDAASAALPPARVVFLLDVLHYLSATQQERLVARLVAALEPGGVLILREADAAQGFRFTLTRLAERLCALARGHWRQTFHYRSAAAWRRLLVAHGLSVSERPMSAGTPYANQLIEARKAAT